MPYVHDGSAILKEGELVYDDIDARSGPLLARSLNHIEYLESKVEHLQFEIRRMEVKLWATKWKPCTVENPPPADTSFVVWYPERQLGNGMRIPPSIAWCDKPADPEWMGTPGVDYTDYMLLDIPEHTRRVNLSAPWKEEEHIEQASDEKLALEGEDDPTVDGEAYDGRDSDEEADHEEEEERALLSSIIAHDLNVLRKEGWEVIDHYPGSIVQHPERPHRGDSA
jgi:hypothetical protein